MVLLEITNSINWSQVFTTALFSFLAAGITWIGAYIQFKQKVLDKFEHYETRFTHHDEKFKVMEIQHQKDLKGCHERITKHEDELTDLIKDTSKRSENGQLTIAATLTEMSKSMREMYGKIENMAGQLKIHMANTINQ